MHNNLNPFMESWCRRPAATPANQESSVDFALIGDFGLLLRGIAEGVLRSPSPPAWRAGCDEAHPDEAGNLPAAENGRQGGDTRE